LKTLDMPKVRP